MKKSMKKQTKKKGFTLIELIVVMAVILVLSSFMFPKFSGYKSKATNVKAIDTGRQIYTSVFMSNMEKNNELNEGEIKNTINELVGAEVGTIRVGGKVVDIDYKVDKNDYELHVEDSGYSIKDKKDIIYSSHK